MIVDGTFLRHGHRDRLRALGADMNVLFVMVDFRGYTTRKGRVGRLNRPRVDGAERMFAIAIERGQVTHQPHIELFTEHNTRTGFFEREPFEAERAHLSPVLGRVATVAYITGWRVDSEILPLQWRHVDLEANELRLDSDTTKNDDSRVFPMTDELRAVIDAQRAEAAACLADGKVCAFVFFRMIAKGRGGVKRPALKSTGCSRFSVSPRSWIASAFRKMRGAQSRSPFHLGSRSQMSLRPSPSSPSTALTWQLFFAFE
jgi:integrase